MATVHECASLVTKALIEKMINYQPPYIIGHASAEDIHYLSGHDSPLIVWTRLTVCCKLVLLSYKVLELYPVKCKNPTTHKTMLENCMYCRLLSPVAYLYLSAHFLQHQEAPQPLCCAPDFHCCSCLTHWAVLLSVDQVLLFWLESGFCRDFSMNTCNSNLELCHRL